MKHHILFGCFSILFLFSCTRQAPDTSPQAVVSAASPEASDAGIDILSQGGNAADAAVATAFVLGVTEPAMSGLGGGMQILLALPGEKPIAINGASISPAATPVDASLADLQYHQRSTIPSTVKVLHYTWKKYGSGNITWAELLRPAIQYAEQGFVVGPFRHMVYKKYEKNLKGSPHHTHFFLLPDGHIPAAGDTLKQPLLAQTLRRLAEKGAADFYQGQMAEQIAADMQANEAWMSLDDLKSFPEPNELEPIHINYRGFDIYSQPPPCGGWTALLALNILENYPVQELQAASESRFQHILQALHLAHQERKQAPIQNLQHYQAFLDQKLDKSYAKSLLDQYLPPAEIPSGEENDNDGETTHYSILDKDGMALAVTASINAYFGAAATSAELGFLYNTYMDDFEFGQPEHPYAIGPGKMNYSSMSPTMVQKDGKTVLIIGSPGSARIISAVAQLTQLWIDSEMGIEAIVATPRLHSINGKVYYEDRDTPQAWLDWCRAEGFEVAFPTYDLSTGPLNAYFGGVHAIAKESGKWVGVADPRRDGKTKLLQ